MDRWTGLPHSILLFVDRPSVHAFPRYRRATQLIKYTPVHTTEANTCRSAPGRLDYCNGLVLLSDTPSTFAVIANATCIVSNAPITTATKPATLQHNGQAHAHSQRRLSQWRVLSGGRLDGAAAYWRPSKYSSSEKLPHDWLQLEIKCIILSMYLIMHNSSATVLAVLSFSFYCSCNRGLTDLDKRTEHHRVPSSSRLACSRPALRTGG